MAEAGIRFGPRHFRQNRHGKKETRDRSPGNSSGRRPTRGKGIPIMIFSPSGFSGIASCAFPFYSCYGQKAAAGENSSVFAILGILSRNIGKFVIQKVFSAASSPLCHLQHERSGKGVLKLKR
jgi:hypothetical protein